MNQSNPSTLPPRRITPGLVGAAAFTGIYLLLALVGAVATGNAEFLFYLAVMGVLVAVVAAVHWRVGLSVGALWGLSVWGGLHMAGGLVPTPAGWPYQAAEGVVARDGQGVLYSLWLVVGYLKFDHLVHAYGFGIATWVCWQALRRALAPPAVPTPGLMVLCAAAGLGLGAINEVVEFVAVLTVPETNVGGYLNTGWDLVANTVGAGVAGLWIWGGSRRFS